MIFRVARLQCLGLALCLSACTKGVPQLDSFGSNIPGFTFNGQSTVTIATHPGDNIVVSGQCDTRIQEIKISYDNAAHWDTVSGSDVDCSDGQFSLTATSTSIQSRIGVMAVAATKSFILKGITKLGDTRPALITVKWVGGSNVPGETILTASVSSSRPNFIVTGRIGAPTDGAMHIKNNLAIKPGTEK